MCPPTAMPQCCPTVRYSHGGDKVPYQWLSQIGVAWLTQKWLLINILLEIEMMSSPRECRIDQYSSS